MRVVAVLLALCAGRLAKVNDSPVTKVVELLTDLKAKIEADGRTEQTIYDKYACWCEETTARKAAAIEEGKTQIEALSQAIVEANARAGSSVAELAKLAKDLAKNAEAQKAAEAMRNKEHNEYVVEKGELEQGVAQLTKAVAVLGAGTTFESKEKERWNSADHEAQLLTVAAGVRAALRLYTSKDREMANGQDMTPVKSFLSDPAAWVQTKAPHLQEYAPQSSAIQGILKQMLDDFNQNLVDGKAEEDQKKTDYDSLMETKRADHALLKSTLESKTTSSADSNKQLADDSTLREETQAQLTADGDFFDSLKQGCRKKADEWAARSRVRTEELGGINEAVGILSSDSATATFSNSSSTFVQVSQDLERSPRKAAYNALKAAATRTKSVQLAALASRVYMTGHFDDVIKEIDTMVSLLRKEQQDDIDHRDWCESERSKANSKTESLEYDMESLTNLIARLNNKKAELAAQITNTLNEINDVDVSMNESKASRNEENTQFRQAMKDDADAVELLGKAIEVLAEIYPSFLQQEPTDNEPESWAGGKAEYGGRQSEGTGIVSILEMIREDVQKEMGVARTEEGEANANYEKLRTESTATKHALEAKQSQLNQETAAVDKKIAENEAVHFDKEETHTAETDYLTDLKPNCDWVDTTFDTRKEQRDAEISGLANAKSILSGAGYEEPGLVAKKAQVTKTVTKVVRKAGKESDVDTQLDELDAESLKWTSFLQRKA